MSARGNAALVLVLVLALTGACGGGGDGPCDRNAVGNICTIGGSGENGYDMTNEDRALPAVQTPLSLPTDTLTAADGTVYVVDWNNHRLRKITADGMIHFVAGNGELGGSLDDPAKGNFNHPTGIIFDPTGTLIYISAWHNSKVRILDPATGTITDSCGDGRRAYFGDDTPALTASLDLPASIAWDPHNNLVIMDQANQVIRVVDQVGVIHRMAGNCVVDEAPPTGPGACPAGTAPTVCPAPSGKTVCGDPAKFCSIACGQGYAGDDGPATQMRMAQAFGQSADPGGRIAYDKQGNLYFADTANNLIRVIDTQGMVHRVAGQPPPALGGFSGDGGPALAATLNHPVDIALADDGTIYFTEVLNHCVRAIAPDKTIHTVAGQCGVRLPEDGSVVEGVPATSALLFKPYGVEWVAPHTLYIADSGNNVIRAVRLP